MEWLCYQSSRVKQGTERPGERNWPEDSPQPQRREIPHIRRPTSRRRGMQEKPPTSSVRNDARSGAARWSRISGTLFALAAYLSLHEHLAGRTFG